MPAYLQVGTYSRIVRFLESQSLVSPVGLSHLFLPLFNRFSLIRLIAVPFPLFKDMITSVIFSSKYRVFEHSPTWYISYWEFQLTIESMIERLRLKLQDTIQ
jgi:hypothetical protein